MWVQGQEGHAKAIGEQARFGRVRIPSHTEVERYDVLSHGRHGSARNVLTCRGQRARHAAKWGTIVGGIAPAAYGAASQPPCHLWATPSFSRRRPWRRGHPA